MHTVSIWAISVIFAIQVCIVCMGQDNIRGFGKAYSDEASKGSCKLVGAVCGYNKGHMLCMCLWEWSWHILCIGTSYVLVGLVRH